MRCALECLKSTNKNKTEMCDLLLEYGFNVNLTWFMNNHKEINVLTQCIKSLKKDEQLIRKKQQSYRIC